MGALNGMPTPPPPAPTSEPALSLGRRLGRLMMVTTGCALLLAYLGSTITEVRHYHETTLSQLERLAELTASNSRAAVAFHDADAAAEMLAPLQQQPEIVGTWLRDADGRVLASTRRADGADWVDLEHGKDAAPTGWYARHLTLRRDVVLDQQRIGEVEVRANLAGMWLAVARQAGLTALLYAACFAATMLVVRRARHDIADPVIELGFQRDARADPAPGRRAACAPRGTRAGGSGPYRRAARGDGARRGGEPREVAVPREHEP